jgi:hypothetical protein
LKYKFSANNATYDILNDAHVLGLTKNEGIDGYIILQRSISNDDDDGIYVEFKDQKYSGYNLIVNCTLSKNEFKISLKSPIGSYNSLEIKIEITKEEKNNFIRGISYVFRNKNELITILEN